MMNGLSFLINLLWILSLDVIIGFILFMIYKYVDLKYYSNFEINVLKEENKFLKQENRKLNGTSTNFWEDKDDNFN